VAAGAVQTFARSVAEFGSLADFLGRVAPNAKERRLLAKSGALNGLPETGHRRQAMWQVEDHGVRLKAQAPRAMRLIPCRRP
jgi:hypothetical protein